MGQRYHHQPERDARPLNVVALRSFVSIASDVIPDPITSDRIFYIELFIAGPAVALWLSKTGSRRP
jgi:hypothetical protein